MIDGLLVVDKPAGMTSHDVVGRCRRVLGQKRVGHAGTLDPDATGVLLVGLGRATRLLRWLTGLPKRYEGEIVLGVATTTLDAAGEVTGRWDMTGVTIEQAGAAAARLTGSIEQVPPMVSALKVGGRRLHQLAREGVEVERTPRRVTVERFELRAAGAGAGALGAAAGALGGAPVFAFDVSCSSGTYVRSLAADLGALLGGGAHLRALRRTAVGPWSLADAVALGEVGPAHVLPPVACLPGMAKVRASGPVAAAVGHGKVLDAGTLGVAGEGPWAVVDPSGDLLAVYEGTGAGGAVRVKPAVVLVGGAAGDQRRAE
ncbi:MAG: tRNA pseudouridine(55) synthase TruB [Acidimicrobiales bacterium]